MELNELAYHKLIEEYKLNVSDLPEDAKTGINNIAEMLKGIKFVQSKGRTVKADTIKKLKMVDKWTCFEIMDYVNNTDKNAPIEKVEEVASEAKEEIKEEVKVVKEESKQEPKQEPKEEVKMEENKQPEVSIDTVGIKVDQELEKLLKANKISFTFEELKDLAPTAYKVVFDSYTDGDQNGIETSNFKVLETEKEKFTLSTI